MRTRNATLFSSILLFLMACHADSVNVPMTDASANGLKPSFSGSVPCPPGYEGYECQSADALGAVPARLDLLEANCPEACGPGIGEADSVKVDYAYHTTGSTLDALYMRCSPTNTVLVASNSSCWDCRGGCGGKVCNGEQCETVTIPNTLGGDCQGYRCDVSQGWTYFTTGGFSPPICMRSLTPGTLSPPYTYASVEGGNPYLTWDAVPGAAAYRVYRQLQWQAAPEVWYTWLTETSYRDWSSNAYAPPQSQPDPAWGTTWMRYHVVSLAADGTESSHVNANVHYYHGTGPY